MISIPSTVCAPVPPMLFTATNALPAVLPSTFSLSVSEVSSFRTVLKTSLPPLPVKSSLIVSVCHGSPSVCPKFTTDPLFSVRSVSVELLVMFQVASLICSEITPVPAVTLVMYDAPLHNELSVMLSIMVLFCCGRLLVAAVAPAA